MYICIYIYKHPHLSKCGREQLKLLLGASAMRLVNYVLPVRNAGHHFNVLLFLQSERPQVRRRTQLPPPLLPYHLLHVLFMCIYVFICMYECMVLSIHAHIYLSTSPTPTHLFERELYIYNI
jgi:hypothetical protein